jgi:hypothetical protein
MNTNAISYIGLILGIVSLLMVVWALLRLNRLDRVRKQFFSNSTDKNLESVLVDQNRSITQMQKELTELNEKTMDLSILNKSNYQKVGFMRYDPFHDSAGNISFSLALLNGKNDGVVISSLHSREGVRIYAKSLTGGGSESKLTEEELTAINNAR